MLHHRQGLLAETKDIGQSSSASQGESLMNSRDCFCSIVVQLFVDLGHVSSMHISYNWSSPSLLFFLDVMVFVCRENFCEYLHHKASGASLSLYAVDVLLGDDVPGRHVLLHALRVAGGFAR